MHKIYIQVPLTQSGINNIQILQNINHNLKVPEDTPYLDDEGDEWNVYCKLPHWLHRTTTLVHHYIIKETTLIWRSYAKIYIIWYPVFKWYATTIVSWEGSINVVPVMASGPFY